MHFDLVQIRLLIINNMINIDYVQWIFKRMKMNEARRVLFAFSWTQAFTQLRPQ